MKISVNWLKQFTTIKGSIDELVTRIGSQLGEVEEVINLGERYKGVVVAKVVSCEKHPNADKLSVCLVDDGKAAKGVERNKDGLVQVVCGAPNVRAGLLVAWIPPGNIVPETFDGEQFTLDVRELRGVKSNGMLASQKELAIGENHDGILVVDEPAKPGDSFASVYELDDYIIDIENKMFTHRPDCFGLLGVAREIAGISQLQFKSPSWYLKAISLDRPKDKSLALEVKNELPEHVPRFMAVAISGVKVGASPIKMQSYLARVGLKPINNVVDITNYCMYVTAQPLHAYDYDKLLAQDKGAKAATLVVKRSVGTEAVSLLNGQTIKPRAEAIVIATKQRLVGIGGVMGGTETAVDKNTTNIVLEVATFNMYSIRKTSMVHGLFTDAVTRFNKGQSPMQNDKVLAYAVTLLEDLAGGQVASKLFDEHKSLPKLAKVSVSAQFINRRLGSELAPVKMAQLLKNVEFSVQTKAGSLAIIAPFWRTDIEIPEDIVEEVGRLYGYDQLSLKLPMRDITPAKRDEVGELKSKIRDTLSAAGANEVLTYSFVSDELLSKVEQNPKDAYRIANAISPELQYYRLSLLPSLLEKIHLNMRAGYDQFALFEIGKTHRQGKLGKDKLPLEFERTALVFTAESKTAQAYSGAAFYQARVYLAALLKGFGVEDFEVVALKSDSETPYFDVKRSGQIIVGDDSIGYLGEFKLTVRQKLKLPSFSAGFEIDTLSLRKMAGSSYKPLSRFPGVQQDISLALPEQISYEAVNRVMLRSITSEIKNDANLLITSEPIDIYQAENYQQKHMSFRLQVTRMDRTLQTIEVNDILSRLADALAHETKAKRL